MTTCDIYSQQIPHDQIYNMLNPSSSYFWQQLLPPHQEKKRKPLHSPSLCCFAVNTHLCKAFNLQVSTEIGVFHIHMLEKSAKSNHKNRHEGARLIQSSF